MNVAIKNQDEEKWICWMDIPEEDVLELVNHYLYDDCANAQEVTVHVWEDGSATPDAVRDAAQNDKVEMHGKG